MQNNVAFFLILLYSFCQPSDYKICCNRMKQVASHASCRARDLCFEDNQHIIRWRENGKSISEIAALLDTSRQRVEYRLCTFDPAIRSPRAKKCGRPQAISTAISKSILQKIENTRFISARKIAVSMHCDFGWIPLCYSSSCAA